MSERGTRAIRTARLRVVTVASLGACQPQSDAYTLYRGSVVDPGARLLVATFDTVNGDEHNRENCRIAAELFARQPGVVVRYSREKGRVRA